MSRARGGVWKALKQLNPGATVREASRPFTIALVGETGDDIAIMSACLLGDSPAASDVEVAGGVIRPFLAPVNDQSMTEIRKADFVLLSSKQAMEKTRGGVFIFDAQCPENSLRQIACCPQARYLRLSLARRLPAFRTLISRRIVHETARENGVFAVATALGNVVPNALQPILGAAEAAGDMAFLTANQVRMLFMLGAVHGERIGYPSQWRETASIVGAGFGWRSIARNLVSKIPFGGGLIPKGAVAYAGTAVMGEGIFFYYTTGRRMTPEEIKSAFRKCYSEGVRSLSALPQRVR